MFHIGYTYLVAEDFNKHLDYIKDEKYLIKWYSYEEAMSCNALSLFPYVAYIKVCSVTISLTYKKDGKWLNYKHNLSNSDNREDIIQDTDPKNAYAVMQRYCHFKDLWGQYGYNEVDDKVYWSICNLGGIRYFNKEKAGKRYDNVICYDMNSAFLSACIDLIIPDTEQLVGKFRTTEDGEIGFTDYGEPVYNKSNKFCLFIFKQTINKDLNRWALNIFSKKKNAKTKAERQKYKDMGNFAIGNLARHNPFIRNCILYKCNQVMLSLMDENTLLCNTDSIVSLKTRDDLKIGDKLGEFKVEKTGVFALNYNGYQWGENLPTISGFTKEKAIIFREIVGRAYDILVDDSLEDFFLPREFDVNNVKVIDRCLDEDFRKYLRRIYG